MGFTLHTVPASPCALYLPESTSQWGNRKAIEFLTKTELKIQCSCSIYSTFTLEWSVKYWGCVQKSRNATVYSKNIMLLPKRTNMISVRLWKSGLYAVQLPWTSNTEVVFSPLQLSGFNTVLSLSPTGQRTRPVKGNIAKLNKKRKVHKKKFRAQEGIFI